MMPCFGDDADFLTFQLEKGCLPIGHSHAITVERDKLVKKQKSH